MAVNGEVKLKGNKLLKYNLVDNTWYNVDNLKPMWWFKFDDNYAFANNLAVPLNEYYFSNAGIEHINLKTVIAERLYIPTCSITISVQDIICNNHGLVLGEMITPTTTGAGFTANAIYYVVNIIDENTFRLSTTYTTTNNIITPTATIASSTWFKRHGITTTASVVTEGYRSIQFDGTNHIKGDYIIGTIPTDKILTNWSIYLYGRLNSTAQAFPAGITPNMCLLEIKDGTNFILIERTPTNQLSLNFNNNILLINITNAFNINSSLPWYIFITYDNNTLTFKFSQTLLSEYEEKLTISDQILNFNSSTTTLTIGAKNDGTNCLSRLFFDSVRFYDRHLSDEEFLILYNSSDGNNFSTISPIYKYLDLYRWLCEESNSNIPMQQIGYNGRITPNIGTTNLLRINDNTGVLVNQIENNIKCYKFTEINKGYLSSSIDFANLPNTDGITFSFWFKDTSTTTLRRRWITNSILATGRGSLIFNLGEDNSAQNTIRLNVDNIEILINTENWKNTWNLWTLVLDGTKNKTSLYKNTTLIGTVNDAILNPSAGFYVGGKNTTTDSEYINGFICDIMIKPYKMCIGEMKLIYNNGKPLQI